MRRSLLAALYFGLWALVSATSSLANGIFESVTGDVKAAVGTATPARVARNQRFTPGTTVLTGAAAQAVLRFDDGQRVVLNENTEFRVNQYSFDKNKPQSDNIALQLLKGAMRSVSGLIGSRSHSAFALIVPQATIGIRGTDFMVALVNPAYLSVLQGEIGVTNATGLVAFSAGSTATVASSTAIPVAIPASALPPSVATAFGNLSSVAIAGAYAATGAASGGISAGVIAAGAAVIGVAVGASTSNDNNQTTTTVTTQ